MVGPRLRRPHTLLLLIASLSSLVQLACKPEVQGPSPSIDAGERSDGSSADSAQPPVDGGVPDTSSVDGGGVVPGCNGECSAMQATTCTCNVSDPCNWSGDGYCDTTVCAQVVSTPFDDGADCSQPPPSCDGSCEQNQYTTCTCGSSDPCGWSSDGYCDNECDSVVPGGAFDDSTDCGGTPPPPANACNGTCGNGAYDSCTCAASDPCGRAGNGTCDQSACAAVLGSAAFNDSADCGGWDPTPAGAETFGVTAVYDNLDPGDMDVVANALPGLGFTQSVRDTNVTTTTLAGYLGRNLTLLYHTGHGDTGQVLTYDGSYTPSDGTINVQHTVFATCLTLESYAWRSVMGSTAQSLFGYTEVSYDYTDDEVAADLVEDLRTGHGYVQAWYLSNASQSSLYDRWAAYVREGADVVEYSARAQVAPAGVQALGLPAIALEPSSRVRALPALLEDARRFPLGLPALWADAAPTPHARELQPGRWSLLADGAGAAKLARDQAEAFVAAQLGGMPADAELDAVVPILTRRGEGEASVAGYHVRYRRVLGGLPLRGNGVADHLSVLVAGRGVVAWTAEWPQRRSERVLEPSLDVASALRAVAPSLARAAKGPLRILGASPAWGVVRGREALVPAFALHTDSGQQVVVNARTGQLLR